MKSFVTEYKQRMINLCWSRITILRIVKKNVFGFDVLFGKSFKTSDLWTKNYPHSAHQKMLLAPVRHSSDFGIAKYLRDPKSID